MDAPKLLVKVWLDGEPKPGDGGDSTLEFEAAVRTQDMLFKMIRMIGMHHGTRPGREIRVSVRDLAADQWRKPNGNLTDEFVAYAVEADVRYGSTRQ